MSTKQLIEEEIELMDEEQLREIYQFIQRFSLPKERAAPTGLMGKLKGVHIEAPEDYASNLDEIELSEEHKQIILTEIEAHRRNPSTATSREELMAKMRAAL